ncbi:flagellar hook assembly protein FlgD [Nitrospira sp. M1]
MDAITSLLEPQNRPVNAITAENVQELGRDVFLRLLVSQLESQDPTNPVENEDFIAQLAQFTSLEQTTNINENLESLIGQSSRQSNMELVNLIGREISAQGNVVPLQETGDATMSYVLEENAKTVEIDVLNEKGTVIRRLTNLGSQEAGAHQIVWDGEDQSGDRVDAGTYSFLPKAINPDGKEVLATTFMRDIVKSVMIGDEQPLITLVSGKTLLSDDILSVQTQ